MTFFLVVLEPPGRVFEIEYDSQCCIAAYTSLELLSIATVCRKMSVIRDAGTERETDFGDGLRCFEHKYEHYHHDHLVCLKCGRIIELISPEIEKLQENLAKKHRFKAVRHRIEIFGICRTCKRK